jgi:MFS family permease
MTAWPRLAETRCPPDTGTEEPYLPAHDSYAALRFRDYRLLLCGGVLSSIGGQMQSYAVGWEVYHRTRSPHALAYVGLVQFLPVLLLALPAGHVADHYSRKYVFQAALITTALASLGLTALSVWQGPVQLVYPCLVLAAVGRAFNAPARSSLLAQVVPLDALHNAVTWNSSGWQIANVAGPALGGIAVALTGRAAPNYFFAALAALGCACLLTPIRPRLAAGPPANRTLASLLDGIKFLWRSEVLLGAITLDLFAVLLGGATALLPVYAEDILHVGPLGLGLMRAAPAVGAFVMALALAHSKPMARPGRTLLLAVAGFGAATIVFGFSTDFWLSLAMLALIGAFDNVSVVVRGTLMQTLTPDPMRGRVLAVNVVFISSSNELGEFESGKTAAWFGPVASVVGGGVGTMLVVLLAMWRWPSLLRLGPLHKPAEILASTPYKAPSDADFVEPPETAVRTTEPSG